MSILKGLLVFLFGCVVGTVYPLRLVTSTPRPIQIEANWLKTYQPQIPPGWSIRSRGDNETIYIAEHKISKDRCEAAVDHLRDKRRGTLTHTFCTLYDSYTVDIYKENSIGWPEIDPDIFQALAYISRGK